MNLRSTTLSTLIFAGTSAFAQGVVPMGTTDLDDVANNLEALLREAQRRAGGQPIDLQDLQNARLSLCPLFPFC